MRLKSPAQFWVKYLMLHPSNYGNDEVKERLIDDGLDYVSTEYLERVRKRLEKPEHFSPLDRRHAPSFGFLIKERVNRAFFPDSLMAIAKDILASPRAKEFVETMLLARAPLGKVADYVSRERNIFCTASALEVYQHYFWNIDLLDATQMRLLLELRIDQAAALPEYKDKVGALRHAYYKDPRRSAAELPYSPTSAMIASMRLGIAPKRGELAVRMAETRDLAWLRAIEAAQMDGPNDSQKFLNYANGGRILEELLQLVARPEEEMREQLSALMLRTEKDPVPSIHQLSLGAHTTDLSPPQEIRTDDDSESGEEDGNDPAPG